MFLQIWDTAGQERFRSMTSAFYSKAQGVVVTFDVSERDTFLALPSWIRDIRMVGFIQIHRFAYKTSKLLVYIERT